MPRNQFDNHGRFTGGGLAGAGGRFMMQALSLKPAKQVTRNKNLVRAVLSPMLRDELRVKHECTDMDIDEAIEAGVTQFSDDFKTFLAQQRKVMTPPKGDE